jgi:ribonuclease HII
MTTVCGVEEAGRGPVIGPLVMAAVVIDEKDEEKLQNMGVKDSKQLSPLQRERMFDRIKLAAKDYKIVIVSPKEVDAALEGEELNLNWLEAVKSAELINKFTVDKVILDCPSNNTIAYKQYVKKRLKQKDVKVIAEHKADENYLVVGAASILAKVTRDREIEKIKKKIKHNFGSGYPSDPKTKQFLTENFEKYADDGIFRKSWQSYKVLVKKKHQKKMRDF